MYTDAEEGGDGGLERGWGWERRRFASSAGARTYGEAAERKGERQLKKGWSGGSPRRGEKRCRCASHTSARRSSEYK